MKPADLFDPAGLPDDLQWLAAEYHLQPNDPAFLLIAWHWHRAQQAEDTLRAALLELESVLDNRVERLSEAAESVAELHAALAGVQISLEKQAAAFAGRMEAELRRPLADALQEIHRMEQAVRPLASVAERAGRQFALAGFAAGCALGAAVTAWLLPQ